MSCPFGDLACPCQDGDPCHYVDLRATKAMSRVPTEYPFEFSARGPANRLVLWFRCYYCDLWSTCCAHHPWCSFFQIRIFEAKP